jgi:Family of unknown function (DUF6085)
VSHGPRIKWATGSALMQMLEEAAEESPATLRLFAEMMARDYRDHVAEHGRRRVYGYCPMGCGESLFLATSGFVECVKLDCPNPVAVSQVLQERETEHLVTFDEDGWQAKHPLRERIRDELLSCPIGDAVAIMLKGDPGLEVLGTYRVAPSPIGPGGWGWKQVNDGADPA